MDEGGVSDTEQLIAEQIPSYDATRGLCSAIL